VTDDGASAAILEALESAGLAEIYHDGHGRQTMRLTEEGSALARELGILEHGPGGEASERPSGLADEARSTLQLTNSFGTAVGAAMLGFEQALRSEPPPEILASEHRPARNELGSDEVILIEFPDAIERADR
jgi:DNA-binding PadR family transcriptional regulator